MTVLVAKKAGFVYKWIKLNNNVTTLLSQSTKGKQR